MHDIGNIDEAENNYIRAIEIAENYALTSETAFRDLIVYKNKCALFFNVFLSRIQLTLLIARFDFTVCANCGKRPTN